MSPYLPPGVDPLIGRTDGMPQISGDVPICSQKGRKMEPKKELSKDAKLEIAIAKAIYHALKRHRDVLVQGEPGVLGETTVVDGYFNLTAIARTILRRFPLAPPNV